MVTSPPCVTDKQGYHRQGKSIYIYISELKTNRNLLLNRTNPKTKNEVSMYVVSCF